MNGFAFNGKFPPGASDSLYHGYKTPAQECLFYDFAVQGYDLMVKYKGVSYYFMVDTDWVWLSDENFTATVRKFDNGNAFVSRMSSLSAPSWWENACVYPNGLTVYSYRDILQFA